MKRTLIGLTLAISLTAGGAWAEDDPVGRYTTIVRPDSGQILVTDTQRGRVKICSMQSVVLREAYQPWMLRCSKWMDIRFNISASE